MAGVEQGPIESALTESFLASLPILENVSPYEHDALLDAHTAERHPPRLRRMVGELAVAGSVGATLGLAWLGVPIKAGPLDGNAKPTLDGRITLEAMHHGKSKDASLSFPSNLRFGMGAKISLDNLPVEITKNGIIPTRISPGETAGFATFFTNYDQYLNNGKRTAEGYAELYGFLGMASWLAIRISKQELQDKEFAKKFPSAKIGKLTLAAGLIYSAVSTQTMVVTDSPQGMAISSEYSGAPSNVIISGSLVDFVQNRREYFDHMSKRQEKALKGIPPVFNGKNVVKILAVEGTGCDSGVTRLAGEAADQLKPDMVIDAGDAGIGGTMFDRFCLQDSLEQMKGHQEVRVLGNHDPVSGITEKWVTYLKGKPIEKSGIRILGSGDTDRTQVFNPELQQLNRENRRQAAKRLAKIACKDQSEHPEMPSIFVSNQPSLGAETARQDCATIVLSGGEVRHLSTDGATIRYSLPRANGVRLSEGKDHGLRGLVDELPNNGVLTYMGLDKLTGAVYFLPIIDKSNGDVSLGRLQSDLSAFPPQNT